MDCFDYIVVGAGSAGCVLANRLSADARNSVLLIESGPSDDSPYIHLPRGNARLMGDPDLTWAYEVARNAGDNNPEIHVRGKVLGGSSSINGQIYLRGLPEDYDDWKCRGWDWEDFLRTFKAIEDYEGSAAAWRGAGGPLRIGNPKYRQPICEAVLAAAGAMGIPVVDDLNEDGDQRLGYHACTVREGRRQSSARAFLKPARRRANLHVLTNTTVDRILFEGRRAVGVITRGPTGNNAEYRTGREIVLSAGAIHSPKILQLSGIGDAGYLGGLGIDVVAHVPQVGKNLAEHRLFIHVFGVSHGSDNDQFRGWRLYRNALDALLFGSGPLTRCVQEVGGYVRTRPEVALPDARILMGAYALDFERSDRWETRPMQQSAVSCGGHACRPRSRGTLTITSRDPAAQPEIVANYLSDEEDRLTSIGIVRFIRKLFNRPELASFAPKELWPGPSVSTDDEIVDAFVSSGVAGLHITGTCSMGEGSDSVVDPELKVRGVEGLRVADISIMPGPMSGNTNAPAMAIGYRAADFMLRQMESAVA